MAEVGAYPSLLITYKISSEKQELYYCGLDDFIKEGNIYWYLAEFSVSEVGRRAAS